MVRVALAGKPNTGKSTLFNLLSGRDHSIISPIAGVTRDMIGEKCRVEDQTILLYDCGGIGESEDELGEMTRTAALKNISQADAVLFLLDIHHIDAEDKEIFNLLRKSSKPILYCLNKADNPQDQSETNDFFLMGGSNPVIISCKSKTGLTVLRSRLAEISKSLDQHRDDEQEKFLEKKADFSLAIIGKPNSGKSSLLNRFLGEERAMVSPVAGTTRDSISETFTWKGKRIRVVDTAGLRRRSSDKDSIENFSVQKAVSAIRSSDISILLLDASTDDSITDQDKKIAAVAANRNRPFIIAVNKWDLVKGKSWKDFEDRIRYLFPHAAHTPVISLSATTGRNAAKLLDTVVELYTRQSRTVSTAEINKLLKDAVKTKAPRRSDRGALNILYATQTSVSPPKFTVFVNDLSRIYPEYEKYLINTIRKNGDFAGAPIILEFRTKPQNRSKKV